MIRVDRSDGAVCASFAEQLTRAGRIYYLNALPYYK
jgi:hypothetical protein